VVNPSSTTVYTLNYSEGGSPCPAVTSTVTVGNQLSVLVTASDNSICAGETTTLTASSSATTYSWSTGSSANTTTVAPLTTTTYSVGALNGFCVGGNTITIVVLPNPTITAALSPTSVCAGSTYTITGAGGTDYLWILSSTSISTVNPITFTAGVAGPRSYTLLGQGANGCIDGTLVNFTVNPSPTVTANASNTLVCTNSTVALTGAGATTYAWSGGGTSTSNPFTFTTGTSGSVQVFSVTGTSAGCSATASVAITVSVCNTNPVGIQKAGHFTETAIFPNPFTTEIKITDLEGTVEVYNGVGALVLRETVDGSAEIKTTELPKGVYFVKALNVSGEHVKTVRLLKN
jgi:hypothetical protein